MAPLLQRQAAVLDAVQFTFFATASTGGKPKNQCIDTGVSLSYIAQY